MLKLGDSVMIYEDPITRQKPEGRAILRELYSKLGNETRWRVEFEDEPGQFYERTIHGEETELEPTE